MNVNEVLKNLSKNIEQIGVIIVTIITVVATVIGVIQQQTGGEGSSGNENGTVQPGITDPVTPGNPGGADPATPVNPGATSDPNLPAEFRNRSTVRLAEIKPVTSNFNRNSSSYYMNGKLYSDSYRNNSRVSVGNIEFNVAQLTGTFKTLKTTVGFDDNAQYTDVVGQVRVFADGEIIRTAEFRFNKPVNISVNVANTNRLKFEFTNTRNGRSNGIGWTILGSPTLHR